MATKMNIRKLLLPLIGLASLLASSINAQAETTATALIYINPVFNEHPVHLLHPYLDYWHLKGPMVQKVALKVLNNQQNSAQACRSDLATNVTLSLEPYLYYNPQMRVFHSEIIVKAYAGKLEPIAVYNATAQVQGELNGLPEYFIERAYVKAMNNIAMQLQADAKIINLNKAPATQDNNMCLLLNTLPITRKLF